MHGGAWTWFPVNRPHFIKYGTLAWKVAPKAPSVLHGQKLRPIKPAGVLDLKPEAKETSPDKRRKFSTTDRSPTYPALKTSLSQPIPTKRGSLFNTTPNPHKPRDPHDHKNFMNPDICKEQQKQNRTQKEDVRMHTVK
jgi:hypothetical protein